MNTINAIKRHILGSKNTLSQTKTMKNAHFREIETFVFFIGYPRSGHTLIGSLMDAHPEMVIAHELRALNYFVNGDSNDQIFTKILKNSENFTKNGRKWMGYDYKVPGQWQGRFQRIKVIGDKSGGQSSRLLRQDQCTGFIQSMEQRLQKQVKILHIIRNPFDNISTMVFRTHLRNNKPMDESLLKLKIRHYFEMVESNFQLVLLKKEAVLNIRLEEFIKSPKIMLKDICRHLGVEPSTGYLKDCSNLVWNKESQSRTKLSDLWTPELIEQTQRQIDQYDFLKTYNFRT